MKFILVIPVLLTYYSLPGQTKGALISAGSDTSRTSSVQLPLLPRVELSEIEVNAYGTPGQLKAAAGSISVIPSDRLENSAINIVPSLSAVPGAVMQEGAIGTIKLILRGIGSRYPYGTKKIKLFFGDIPMYSAEGETTFDDINPEYISRVEVLRGPASSLYGASLGGTVILYPQTAAYNREEVKYITSAGSFGYLKNGVTYSKGTPASNLVLSLSTIETDGFRQNNQYNRYSFFINHHQIFNKRLSGDLIFSGSRIRAQISSSIDSTTLYTNPQNAAPTWLKSKGYEHPDRLFAGYNLHYNTPGDWDYSVSPFFNSLKTEENRPFNFLDQAGLTYGGRILVQHTKRLHENIYQFTAGTNLFFENIKSSLSENINGNGIKGAMIQNGLESLYQTDLFTQLEIRFRQISVVGGLNFNRSGFIFTDLTPTDTLNQSGNYHFSPIIAPRLSFTWNPLTDLYFYSSVNKGFSIPSLSETLSPLGLINRDIKPEKAWCFEEGLRTSLFNHATFIDLALYDMRVTDLIVPKRIAADIYVGENAGSSLHRGVEVAVNQWIFGRRNNSSDRKVSLMANISYSANRFNFQNFMEDNIDYAGKKLPGMPDQLFSGNLDLRTPGGFYTVLEMNKSGGIPLNDLNSHYSKQWQVMSLMAGYIFSFKHFLIDTTFKINNLTDEKYASMVVVNAPGSASAPPRYFYPGLPRWVTCTMIISYNNIKKKLNN